MIKQEKSIKIKLNKKNPSQYNTIFILLITYTLTKNNQIYIYMVYYMYMN